jgi:glycosyltransferase involved in cell wall biosynthesis
MRIAMVCAERDSSADDLARHLAKAQHEVTVFRRDDGAGGAEPQTWSESASDADPLELDEGAPVRTGGRLVEVLIPAGPRRPLDAEESLEHMAAFGHALADEWGAVTPNVIHAHGWTSGIAAQVGARPLGLPIAQSFTELGLVRRRHLGDADTSPVTRIRLERSLAIAAARVLARSSDEVFELFRMGVPHRHSTVLPCGVDPDVFSRDGSADAAVERIGPGLRIVGVGPLTVDRGHDAVIRAVAAVPASHLILATTDPEGSDAQRLRAVAREAHVADRLHITTWPDDLPAFFRSADLAAIPSWFDPSGLQVLQAMACGTPVLASAVGAHIDIVVDGITGTLTPPRQIEPIAAALRRLSDDPFSLQSMGIAGSDRAQHRFAWTRVAQETLRVYRAIDRRMLSLAVSR